MEDIFILGLCNPGKQFDRTLHNIGKVAIEQLAQQAHNLPDLGAFQDVSTKIATIYKSGSITLGYSTHYYMNDSGKVARQLVQNKKLIVIHDEIEIATGRIKYRFGGSAKGHNGLRDIMSIWGLNYWKVGIGVDHPGKGNDVASYLTKPDRPDHWNNVVESAKALNLSDILKNTVWSATNK